MSPSTRTLLSLCWRAFGLRLCVESRIYRLRRVDRLIEKGRGREARRVMVVLALEYRPTAGRFI